MSASATRDETKYPYNCEFLLALYAVFETSCGRQDAPSTCSRESSFGQRGILILVIRILVLIIVAASLLTLSLSFSRLCFGLCFRFLLLQSSFAEFPLLACSLVYLIIRVI